MKILTLLLLCACSLAEYEPRYQDAQWARNLLPKESKISVPTAPALPRIHVSELDLPRNQKYKNRKMPFILTGAMDDWPALKKWKLKKSVSENYLTELFPHYVSDFYPYNMLQQGQHPHLIRFRSGVNEVLNPSGRYSDFSGKAHVCPEIQGCSYIHLQLTPAMWSQLEEIGDIPKNRHVHTEGDQWWMRRCLEDPEVRAEFHLKTHWKIILIGSRGSGMFNHSDSLLSTSWHGHVQGKKWWYVCSPKGFGYEGPQICFESVLVPGEVLYYGAGWFHETRNLDFPSMTITGTVIHKQNFELIADKFLSECAHDSLNFKLSGKLCDALDKCYGVWHKYLKGSPAPEHRWRPWRSISKPEIIQKRDETDPTHNNYDGRNYIAE
jgi:hypothetical protein